jgi:hypothetical protein
MSVTPNKMLLMMAPASFNNAWAPPLNNVIDEIDAALGGTTPISVTGVTAGTYALTQPQYLNPNFEFTGTLTGNLVYVVPSGVGGIWTVSNATTGAFTISIGVTGGSSTAVLQGFRTLIVSDGSTVTLADTSAPAQAQANAEAFATAADAVVLASAESFASSAAATAQSNAEAFSADASNLSSGQVPNAVLPEIGDMPGVTIQADPGGTPIGGPFEMFFYY